MHCMVCLRSIEECVRSHSVFMVIMEMLKYRNIRAYQVSPPCIVWCATLRIEEVVIVNGCQGNAQIHNLLLVSYTASCVPIIMYGLGLFVVVYC